MAGQGDVYEFHIEGHIGSSWTSWFDGLTIHRTPDGDTVLSGPIEDQAALHGVLMKIRDLGLPLVTATRLDWQPGERQIGCLSDSEQQTTPRGGTTR